jgi:hypothetical protein
VYQQTSSLPTQKVATGALAGAVSVILVWALRQFAGLELPAEVASACTMVLSFAVSYFTPPSDRDIVEAIQKGS